MTIQLSTLQKIRNKTLATIAIWKKPKDLRSIICTAQEGVPSHILGPANLTQPDRLI